MKEETLLHRQIHPALVVNDYVSTQAFIETITVASSSFLPNPSDDNKLSVYNGNKFSAKEAHKHYSQNLLSYGVLSVTVGEVNSVKPLSSEEDNDPFDGHCIIDFSKIDSKNQKIKKAASLRDFAIGRNWTYKLEQ